MPGEWVAIEGKVVSVADPPSPAVAQTGVIADSSGAVRFVIFAKNAPALLRKGAWYRLESAVVDEFRGQVNLKVHSGTTITPIDEDRTLEPVITTDSGSLTRYRLSPGEGRPELGCTP